MTFDITKDWQNELEALEALLPSSKANLRRLSALLQNDEDPKIAVFGKYNHGKSSLLNSLIGKNVFKVADKRETTAVRQHRHDHVIWIDTPGLDADVEGGDDALAMTAALESADILCLIHSVKAGELDRSEMQLYRQLSRQDNNYRSKLILVLTQIDQVTPQDLNQVVGEIRAQLPDLRICEVSSMRFLRGVQEGKSGFIKASGMTEFQSYLESVKGEVSQLRKKEARRLIRKARVELAELINDRKNALASAVSAADVYEKGFWTDFEKTRERISGRALDLGISKG